MNWVVAVWSSIASIGLVLAIIHGLVWLQHRARSADGAFAVLVFSLSAVALSELAMMHARTPAEFSSLLQIYYLPIQLGFVSLIVFIWTYFGAGNRWLGWSAIIVRMGVTIAGVASSGNLHFEELQALVPVDFLGVEVMAPVGTANPWMLLATLSTLLLLAFFIDATFSLWRRGRRRDALLFSFILFIFVTFAMALSGLTVWMPGNLPFIVTVFFAPVVLMMAFRMGQDLVATVRLSEELAAAENSLLVSRKRLSVAAEAAQANFWRVDLASRKLWRTPELRPNLGIDAAQLSLDEFFKRIHPQDREQVRNALEAAVNATGYSSVDYRIQDAQGQTLWYSSIGRRHDSDADGHPAQSLLGMTLDITERKRVLDTLEQQRQQIEQLSRVAILSEVSDAMELELTEPLSQIRQEISNAEKALADGILSVARLRMPVEAVVQASKRAARVVGQLRLLMPRQGRGKQASESGSLVERALAVLKDEFEARSIHVQIHVGSALRRVLIDPLAIDQVVVSLLQHACSPMSNLPPTERQLAVRIENCPEGVAIDLEAAPHAQQPSDDLSVAVGEVFDAFVSLQPSAVFLGLPVCRSIIRWHGGAISVLDGADGGRRVRLVLPVAEGVQ